MDLANVLKRTSLAVLVLAVAVLLVPQTRALAATVLIRTVFRLLEFGAGWGL